MTAADRGIGRDQAGRVAPQTPTREPVTGGASRLPILDRHGRRIHVGDRLRARVCVGPYGQTRDVIGTVTRGHWEYCAIPLDDAPVRYSRGGDGAALVSTTYDPAARVLRCATVHHDCEHGHETHAEIID